MTVKEEPKSAKLAVDSAAKQIHSVADVRKAELQGERIPISDEQLIRAIDRAIKAMQGPTTTFDFSVHEKTKQIVVKVLDKDTGEVIREIPPEKNLDLLAKLWEMAGILVDKRG
ncbi:MAG: flagellar protein FlaG [Paenibacillaceae bacterium]|nr:flagellar protein FlaG [Paenibacillaceae bacterium]